MSRTDRGELGRAAAILAAAIACGPGTPPGEVLATARQYAAFITAVRLTVTTDPLTWHQASARPATQTVITPGGTVQLHDDEQVTLIVSAKDAKGFTIPGEAFTFLPADPAVITPQPASPQPDGTVTVLMVAGNPGSTTVDISDTDGTFHYTWAVDVITAEVATVTVAEGAPEHQPGFG